MSRASGRPPRGAGLIAGALARSRRPVRLWQLALAVLAGNVALNAQPELPAALLVLAVCLASLAAIALSGLRAACLPAVAVLAFCLTAEVARARLDERWPAAADGDDVELVGWIDSLPVRDKGRTVFSLRVVSAEAPVPPRRVRLSWYDPAPDLNAGDALRIVARLRAPRGLVNPGGFDYARWLFLEGYDATGYVRSGGLATDLGAGPARRWLAFRASLVARFGQVVADSDAAALLAALGLGERGGFNAADWAVLQRTGTSHLVAVSGLHIGIVAALVFWLMQRLALRLPLGLARRATAIAATASIAVAGFYAALAGFSLPTRRALVMLVVAEALVLARRRWPPASGLGLALIVVVVGDPLASLSASFWLSFGAVALLLLAGLGPARRRGSRMPARVAGAVEFMRLQSALTLGLAPLALLYFGQVSPVSFLVNLVAIPVFSLVVVPLALLASCAAPFGDPTSALVALAGAVAGLAWHGLELAAGLRFAAIELPQPTLVTAALALAGVALFAGRHRLPGKPLGLLALAPLGLDARLAPAPGEASVMVIDVGQGLAVAVETASHRLLFDAGPLYRSGFDAGAEIVAPVLESLSAHPLDLMLLSHADSDHAGGAPAVLARYPGAAVVAGPDVGAFGADTCRVGRHWNWDGVAFSILHPPAGFGPEGNETSCVLRIDTAGGSLLLTGDIEDRAETRLVAGGGLAADVVVVPHHGSLTSSSRAFVSAVAPKLAIVSAGHGNRWGFPKPEVSARWSGQGAKVLDTGEDGAIELEFRADVIEFTAWRDRERHYWQPKRGRVSGATGVLAL